MKKFKVNRLQQATKEIEALDPSLTSILPSDIAEKEGKYYHVALVKIIDRPGEVKNDVKVVMQKFSEQSFNKLKSNFKFLGYTKIVIVHDPKIGNEYVEGTIENEIETKEKNANAQSGDQVPTKEEIEAEIERRANEKAAEIVKSQQTEQTANATQNANAGDGSEQTDGKGSDDAQNDLKTPDFGSTVEQMKDFAETNGIDLTGLRKKDEIIAALTEWFNDLTDEQKQAFQ